MTGYEAYRLFLALKQHFTQPSYDFFRYNGKIKSATPISYERRSDKYQFVKLGKHYDPQGLIVAQFVAGGFSGWVGDLLTEHAENQYVLYAARRQSLSYLFQRDLSTLEDDFMSFVKVKDGQHPKLLTMLRQEKIAPETIVILNKLLSLFEVWDKKIRDPVIWPQTRDTLLKYEPFVSFDKDKLKSVFRNTINLTAHQH